jgi:hypothetical protein
VPTVRVLPPPGPARPLAVAVLVDWTGTGVWLTVSTLFFVRVVGLRPTEIGVGLAAAGVLGMVAVMPVANLTRRWPAGRVAVALQVCRGLAFLSYLAVGSAPTFYAAAALVAVVDRPATAVIQVLVGRVVPDEERGATMAVLHAAQNLGVAAGAALGALALLRADRASFAAVVVADSASFFVAAWLLRRMLRTTPERLPPTEPAAPAAQAGSAGTAPGRRRRRIEVLGVARHWRFALVTFGNGLLALHMPLLNVVTPLWLAEATAAPLSVMGGLFLLNTAMVVLLQVAVARPVRTPRRGVWTAWIAAGAVAAGCAALAAASLPAGAGAIGLLALAVAMLTIGEMHQNAAGWALSFGLSPADARQPAYIGFFGTGQAGIVVLGPALLTFLLSRQGALAFATTAGLVLLGALCVTAGAAERRRR